MLYYIMHYERYLASSVSYSGSWLDTFEKFGSSLSCPRSSTPGWNTLSVRIAKATVAPSKASVSPSVSLCPSTERAYRRTEEPLDRNNSASPAPREFYHPIDRPNKQESGHGRHANQHAYEWFVYRATRWKGALLADASHWPIQGESDDEFCCKSSI